MYYIGNIPCVETDIRHFGISGMKWGQRRYQNPDGTLTEEGKLRYYKDASGNLKKRGFFDSNLARGRASMTKKNGEERGFAGAQVRDLGKQVLKGLALGVGVGALAAGGNLALVSAGHYAAANALSIGASVAAIGIATKSDIGYLTRTVGRIGEAVDRSKRRQQQRSN